MRIGPPTAALAAALVVFSSPASADDIPKGLEKLQGNWKMVGLSARGKPIPTPRDTTLTVKGDQYTFSNGNARDDAGGTYKPVAAGKAQGLDIVIEKGPAKGRTLLAVYDVKGKLLRICLDFDNKKRPERVGPAAGVIVETWQKVK